MTDILHEAGREFGEKLKGAMDGLAYILEFGIAGEYVHKNEIEVVPIGDGRRWNATCKYLPRTCGGDTWLDAVQNFMKRYPDPNKGRDDD